MIRKNKRQAGFTIIELIVVIGVMVILATIVVINVVQYINKTKDLAIKANLKTLQTQAKIYTTDNPFVNGGNGPYGFDICAQEQFFGPTSDMREAITKLNNGTNTICSGNEEGDDPQTDWCIWVDTLVVTDPGTSSKTWCVDNTGYAGWDHVYCTPGVSICTLPQ